MGLYAFEIKKLAELPLPKPFKVLSFGHPDILATPDELAFIGKLDSLSAGERLDRKAHYKPDVVGSAHRLFKAMGGELTVADLRPGYGVDKIVDLNDWRFSWIPDFDLVIDPGTSEHCFCVGTALANMAKNVKVGGYIYHMVPLCHWNHGFWNFSPCAFADFYAANGFKIIEMRAEYKGRFQDVSTQKKFEIANHGRKLNLMCIARRVSDKPIGFPIQSKYA
jgi:hypothetical protein